MSKALVVYFSITGVTENVAQKLAEAIGADIFEVAPKEPVAESQMEGTGDGNSTETIFRGKDIREYDVIYVGLPIWWYAAPTVIHTFLSDYDLRGKTLIPFATSGGGGILQVRPRLLPSCPGADLREASLLTGDMTQEELAQWAAGFSEPDPSPKRDEES